MTEDNRQRRRAFAVACAAANRRRIKYAERQVQAERLASANRKPAVAAVQSAADPAPAAVDGGPVAVTQLR